MKNVVVTTSWDDGHVLDLKLAALLRRYNLKGTFYISPEDREFSSSDLLTKEQVLELSRDFEIGAHTMTHPRLTQISDDEARKEIENSKKFLEKLINRPVTSFCYPAGYFLEKHEVMAEKAGFKLARTVNRFSTTIPSDHFELNTTIHAYRHWSDALPIFGNSGISNFFNQYLNWDKLAISLFDKVIENGGIFHIWGHSWEIEKNGEWARLEKVFEHIANRSEVSYKTNGELI